MGMWQRRGIDACSDEAGDVRHIDPEPGADLVGDLAHARPIHHSRIGREPADQHLRLVLQRLLLHGVVVDQAGGLVEAVGNDVVVLAREIGRMPVGQVTAVIEAHAHDGVAGLGQRHEHGGIGLRTRVRLHVGVFAVEQLTGAGNGQLLGDVDMLAAAVVALGRVAFGVLVGEDRALRRHYGRAGIVFRGDELDVCFLPTSFVGDCTRDFRIELGQTGRVFPHNRCTPWDHC